MSDYTPPSAGSAAATAQADLYSRLERQFQPKTSQPTSASPAAPTSATATAPAPARSELSLEQRLEKLYSKSQPAVADGAKPTADAQAKPAADAQAKPADAQALPDFIDQNHPDAAAATPIVKELGLGREQVGKLEALHRTITEATITRQSAAWAAEAQRLPPADLHDARAAFARFGNPELTAVLNKSGLGNHPALIRAFAAALRSRR